ncbi:FecR family protein [Leeuwenhoekiella aestuarii]|uniref:FecR family protein n=1 Tax=Leeuwenhoekiella aestuarii TaxID=2249426 RepID=A0A4Q0NQE1_9FLAO|nr:FecR family protein [Leeuwenhoekiella aestuarii]RXG11552.1 FecR family protein [Leeuwenhoekiella aestuarii]RXG12069.1 FecR family protein [Leeuwenhoekiella aestuarii]
MKEKQKEVLKRYFLGLGTTEERELIERFLLNSNNKELSDHLRQEWEKLPEFISTDSKKADARYKKLVIRKFRQSSRHAWYWSAAIFLVLISTGLGYQYIKHSNFNQQLTKDVAWITVSTEVGEQKEIVLPDGSDVFLNYNTSISYPEIFDSETRSVRIIGEAHFEVVKNEKKPFIVCFDDNYTRVLGTSFNIKAYPNSANLDITLIEGKVEVGHIETKGYKKFSILNPNEGLSIRTDNSFKKYTLDNLNGITSWKSGDLYFRQENISEVVKELRRRFEDSIVIKDSPHSKTSTFTTSIKARTSLEDILKILSLTNKLEYNKINDVIYINLK